MAGLLLPPIRARLTVGRITMVGARPANPRMPMLTDTQELMKAAHYAQR